MSCEDFTTNGRPVGIGYDSNGNAKSLSELTTILVSSVSATNYSGITAKSISDFEITEPLNNGQYLVYNSTTGKWENITVVPGEGVANSIAAITVNSGQPEEETITSIGEETIEINPVDDTISITGNNSLKEITIGVNESNLTLGISQITNLQTQLNNKLDDINSENLDELADVVYNGTPALNDVLVWNGTNWENQSSPGGGITIGLKDITDVDLGALQHNNILVYTTATSKWVNLPQEDVFNNLVAVYVNKGAVSGEDSEAINANDKLNFNSTNADEAVDLTINRIGDDISVTINVDGGQLDITSNTSITSIDSDIGSLESTLNSHIGSASVHYASSVVTAYTDAAIDALTFLDLTDTPASYGGYQNSFISVNPLGTGLSFSPLTTNGVVIGDTTGGIDSLEVGEFLRTTLLGSSTNVTTYSYSKVPSGTNIGYLWPEGTLMVYDVDTSSFNLSSPANWWSAVATDTGGLNHNLLGNLTTGNPHTQYATLSGATFTGNISGTNIAISGTLEAATKSFLIDHPTKPDMKLRYACLEGPENGVYYRGKTESNIIELPDYWVGLVDESSISVNLTPIGHIQNTLRVGSINNNTIVLHSESPINCFFIVYGTRKDVPTLQVEF